MPSSRLHARRRSPQRVAAVSGRIGRVPRVGLRRAEYAHIVEVAPIRAGRQVRSDRPRQREGRCAPARLDARPGVVTSPGGRRGHQSAKTSSRVQARAERVIPRSRGARSSQATTRGRWRDCGGAPDGSDGARGDERSDPGRPLENRSETEGGSSGSVQEADTDSSCAGECLRTGRRPSDAAVARIDASASPAWCSRSPVQRLSAPRCPPFRARGAVHGASRSTGRRGRLEGALAWPGEGAASGLRPPSRHVPRRQPRRFARLWR